MSESSSVVLRGRVERMGAELYPRSLTTQGTETFALIRDHGRKRLAVLSNDINALNALDGEITSESAEGPAHYLKVCPTNSFNAAALRDIFPWLRPTLLGLRKSVGFGDRLGLATPGHIRAARACRTPIAPNFAQQSIREMTRTNRTPRQVLDDAMWGVFQEGWREGYGADADHLKTKGDIDRCAEAGYTFFTFDPGESVDDDLHNLDDKLGRLPWTALETSWVEARSRYSDKKIPLENGTLILDEASAARAMVKYGHAVAQVAQLYRHLARVMGEQPFEVEISVDETETPTSPAEHYIIASELTRLQVRWVSLAPRFVGRFEKGVDYIGDLDAFRADFAAHAALARQLGPYKLSLHSGSDKFSLYRIAALSAGELVHLKTAGTSMLSAFRTLARVEPQLFRQIYALARERYPQDRASYHVSAELERAPDIQTWSDGELSGLLDQFDARQMLHVSFGSILAQYGTEIHNALERNEEAHYADLESHFARHLEGFCG